MVSQCVILQRPAEKLHNLLAAEDKLKRDNARKASSRHSRFGTTIAVKLNPNKVRQPNGNDADAEKSTSTQSFILHRQQALTQEANSIWDISKKQRTKKSMTLDELTRPDNLTIEARNILKTLAIDFVGECFNGNLVYVDTVNVFLLCITFRSFSILHTEGHPIRTSQNR